MQIYQILGVPLGDGVTGGKANPPPSSSATFKDGDAQRTDSVTDALKKEGKVKIYARLGCTLDLQYRLTKAAIIQKFDYYLI